MTYLTRSEAETMRFASALAGMLDAGDTVLLEGDLGTGKSVMARGVARALGIAGAMPSPSVTILIPYEGTKKLYHFDLYRLADPDEFYAAGLDEFVGGDGIVQKGIENTIRNVGRLARDGMSETDRQIIRIMLGEGNP
jgi:tRNA threonylcarbamoyladenosine biosynthesis protein TsaE